MSDLGLDVIREVVGVVARERVATGLGLLGVNGPHLLDVVLVVGVDDGRDVKVGEAHPATEEELSEHTRSIVFTVGDGVEVALVVLGELDTLGLAALDGHRLLLGAAGGRGEDDLAGDIVKGLEGDGSGADSGSRGDEAKERLGELHFEESRDRRTVVCQRLSCLWLLCVG